MEWVEREGKGREGKEGEGNRMKRNAKSNCQQQVRCLPPLRSADDPRYSNVSMLITSMIGLTIMFRF